MFWRVPLTTSFPTRKQSRVAAAKSERGSAFIEFLLSSLVWLPLLFGTIVFGINIVRALQVSQLSRDTGHMYAYHVDFTQPESAKLLTTLAAPLGITATGGNGAVVLSKIRLVTPADCTAAGYQSCINSGKYAFTSLIVFGASAYGVTKLGSPAQKYYTSGSSIAESDILNDRSLQAGNFPDVYPNHDVSQQYSWVSEVNVNTQAITWSSFSNTGSYARSIF
jgi:vacuolar-type H+-ATPase subunit I/STV1